MLKRVRVPEPVPAPFNEVSKPSSSGSGSELNDRKLSAACTGLWLRSWRRGSCHVAFEPQFSRI